MLKLSGALAAFGLALIVLSFLPLRGAAAPSAATAVATAIASDAAAGKALFVAKGCASCHHHAAVVGSGALGDGVPDLTTYRWEAEYLRRWLANPAAVKAGTFMPKLDLKPDEIEALIAFLSANKG